jgi:hypothetical protein
MAIVLGEHDFRCARGLLEDWQPIAVAEGALEFAEPRARVFKPTAPLGVGETNRSCFYRRGKHSAASGNSGMNFPNRLAMAVWPLSETAWQEEKSTNFLVWAESSSGALPPLW